MIRGICFPILSSLPSAQEVSCVCDSLQALIGAMDACAASTRGSRNKAGLSSAGNELGTAGRNCFPGSTEADGPALCLLKTEGKSNSSHSGLEINTPWPFPNTFLRSDMPTDSNYEELLQLWKTTPLKIFSETFLNSNYRRPTVNKQLFPSQLPLALRKELIFPQRIQEGAVWETTVPCGLAWLFSSKTKRQGKEFQHRGRSCRSSSKLARAPPYSGITLVNPAKRLTNPSS